MSHWKELFELEPKWTFWIFLYWNETIVILETQINNFILLNDCFKEASETVGFQ